jgi:8-oxo-dGTP pyrophosphatase MutT (NUDIX family)
VRIWLHRGVIGWALRCWRFRALLVSLLLRPAELLASNGRVLLVQERSDARWTLPGGWADVNRSPRECVIAEVREEAGLASISTRCFSFARLSGAILRPAWKPRQLHSLLPTNCPSYRSIACSITRLFACSRTLVPPGYQLSSTDLLNPDRQPVATVGLPSPTDITRRHGGTVQQCQSPTLGGGTRRLPPCPSTLALTCRWRSRPQHQLRKSRPFRVISSCFRFWAAGCRRS